MGILIKMKPPKIPDTTAHYDVRWGDTLWKIAVHQLKSGAYVHDLAKLNGLSANSILQVGQRLIVPNYQRYDLTINYMLEQMKKNVSSSEAKKITDQMLLGKNYKDRGNQAIEDIKKADWWDVFSIYGNQQIFESSLKISGQAITTALALWFIQVHQGGPWDHKPILSKMYESMGVPPRPFGSLKRAFHFPIRGDLFHEYYYDIWSNIHYGYVGTKCGIDEKTLQQGAASGFPGAGDNDEGDVISIKIGIELWKNFGMAINCDSIRNAILSKRQDYLFARQREINSGIKPDDATNIIITENDYK